MRRAGFFDDQASTAIVSFAVVLAIYALAFAALMTVLRQPTQEQHDLPVLDSTAENTILELVSTAGYYVSPATRAQSWLRDPDNITRFGLAQENSPGLLDLDKMRNLTKGSVEAQANGLLDYEEAREALGLGDFDFHLRTYPLFDALADAGQKPVRNVEVAYVGNFSKVGGGADEVVQNVTAIVDGTNVLLVNVTLTNNGNVGTVFQAEFSVPLKDGYLIDTHNTHFLRPGTSQNVTLKLFETSSWAWAGSDKNVSVKISDPSKKVGDFRVDLAPYVLTDESYDPDYALVTADASKVSYRPTQKPVIHFDLWEGDGDTKSGKTVTLHVRNATTGELLASTSDTTGNGKKWTIDSPSFAVGSYDVYIYYNASGRSLWSLDRFEVTAEPPPDFTTGGATTLEEGVDSKYERSLLLTLVDGWTNTTYDVGGDVYPGVKTAMNNDLATNLTAGKYDALVIGSEVDQTALTSNAAKDSIKQFVLGGGLMIVLGSLEQQLTWLQPLFHATLTTSGNSIGVPDPHHPILHSPQELDYLNYQDNGKTWVFNSEEDASHFTHVLTREGGSRQEDILAVSKPGHFGNGTIVLTAWTAYLLTDTQQDEQAQGMLYNFLLQVWGSLYVDLGPRIPDHVEVASSSRMATAPSPIYADEKVLVRLLFYVFR